MLTKPIIHSNGNSAESLLEEYRNALDKLSDAREAVAAITVHPRNYYVSQDQQAYDKARVEQIARLQKLESIRAEIEELAIHVIQFVK